MVHTFEAIKPMRPVSGVGNNNRLHDESQAGPQAGIQSQVGLLGWNQALVGLWSHLGSYSPRRLRVWQG